MSEAEINAQNIVEAFCLMYKAEAIPTLIAACVYWTVNAGGTEIIKQTLKSAVDLADEFHGVIEKMGN